MDGYVKEEEEEEDFFYKIKIILQRSNDRNWRQCNAELKKNIIKLTILREGKATQVC